jgi:CHASE1-domain containing sensor protein/two-component sensor histidine kinase
MIARGSVLFPVLALVIALLIGGGMTWTVWLVESERAQAEFERTADLAVDRVVTRLEQHVVLLRSTRGLFLAQQGAVDRNIFNRFLTGVDLVNELSGIQGIGYARMIATGDEQTITDDVMIRYNLEAEVRPVTDQPWRASIVLIEPPNDRNIAALGFDMYAEGIRRAAMDRAIASGQPQMSGPVSLVQEITPDKQSGVLIYLALPSTSSAPASGFVYAPFRGGDLIRAALASGPPLSVLMTIRDTGAPDRAIFDEGAEGASGLKMKRSVEIVGRQWSFTVAASDGPSTLRRHLGSILVGLISVLFAAAAGLAVRSRQHEATQAREVVAATARESDYRDLLLQEMKHRIKNHIARIQSIARQSARGATDVKAFSETFDARLQAMAAVQEILAGTAVAQADVRAILRRELQQCLDTAEVEHLMDGPSVILDERQAHAFALVAHELVTNAMKYGGLSANGRGLRITWSVQPQADGKPPMLAFDWQEQFTAAPDASESQGTGFGSRLIDVSLKGELSGTLSRDFHAQGLHISLSFPLNPALIKSQPRKK